jgi:hypothetical protein
MQGGGRGEGDECRSDPAGRAAGRTGHGSEALGDELVMSVPAGETLSQKPLGKGHVASTDDAFVEDLLEDVALGMAAADLHQRRPHVHQQARGLAIAPATVAGGVTSRMIAKT